MSPRPYNLGKRQEPIEAARQQVLDAARGLLGGTDRYTAFTVDAVARQADVARATVYYQFGSKAGLLEALCDYLAELGGMSGLAEAFTEPDPRQALRRFVACFGQFWAADRPAMRRLRALALLDPDVGAVITARDQRRHQGLTVLAGAGRDVADRGRGGPGRPRAGHPDQLRDLRHAGRPGPGHHRRRTRHRAAVRGGAAAGLSRDDRGASGERNLPAGR